jgi:hypothetical protein
MANKPKLLVCELRGIGDLRKEILEVAVSVRPDPRDHLLMWISG